MFLKILLLTLFCAAPADSLDGFAGFSVDGKSFAWVAPSISGELRWLKVIAVGESEPKMDVLYPDDPSFAEAMKKLKGFVNARKPPPGQLKLETNLTATPPTAFLVNGKKRVPVPIGKGAYPPTDVATIWGVSADGKHAALRISGPDVPGIFSKGGGRDFIFYFVAPVP
jgi:hypothetical protein